MQKFLFLFLIFFISCGSKTEHTEKTIVDPDYLVSLQGIGQIKTNMYQTEIEKVIGKKIPLTNPQDTISGSYMDSASIKYKDADLRLTFVRAYSSDDNFTMQMSAMETTSPLCKTKDGVGIGSSKQDIINAFPENRLEMFHPYYNDTLPSKEEYVITVKIAKEGPQIVFRLKNNIVHSIEVGVYYDDEE